jgi:hypothetical protein
MDKKFIDKMDLLFENFFDNNRKGVIFKTLKDYAKILFDLFKKCVKEFSKGMKILRNNIKTNISLMSDSINKAYRLANKYVMKSNDRNINESESIELLVKKNNQLYEYEIFEERFGQISNIKSADELILAMPNNQSVSMEMSLKSINENMSKVDDTVNKLENQIINEHSKRFIIDEDNDGQILNEFGAAAAFGIASLAIGIPIMILNAGLNFLSFLPMLFKYLAIGVVLSALYFILSGLFLMLTGATNSFLASGATAFIGASITTALPWLILIPTSIILPIIIYKIIKFHNEKYDTLITKLNNYKNRKKDYELKYGNDEDNNIELPNIEETPVITSEIKEEILNDNQYLDIKKDLDKYRNYVVANNNIDRKIKDIFK